MANLVLRDYQEECVAAHYTYFETHPEGDPLFVVPTGGGKSLIIAEFVRRSLQQWPRSRFLVLTHVKELIEQNYDEFLGHWGPRCPAGIYSAGLGRKETNDSVTFAGIQSLVDNEWRVGHCDIVMVDEAHLVPKKGQGRYRKCIEALRAINPKLRMVGYTATHYRMDGGYLHRGEGRMFTDVAYEVSVEMLVQREFLVPLVGKMPTNVIDTSHVRITSGEFNAHDLEEEVTAEGRVKAAVAESIAIATEQKRKSWLFFCTTKKHAIMVRDELRLQGVRAEVVLGDTNKTDRTLLVNAFKAGRVTALVTVGVLTTGFNAPRCDMLAVMRPTRSASLYVQMMGRGMRTSRDTGKKDCLVLDYGQNILRHGPINAVQPPEEKKRKNEDREPPVHVCSRCQSIRLLTATKCEVCGLEFPRSERAFATHDAAASVANPFDPDYFAPQVGAVSEVYYSRHCKAGSTPTLRVDYTCGMRVVSEWVAIEHPGYAGAKASAWWLNRGGRAPSPETVDAALERSGELRTPAEIVIVRDGKYDRVSRVHFEEDIHGARHG